MIEFDAPPEQKNTPERRVLTILSCAFAGIGTGDETTRALKELLSQAVTTLQVMGASVRIEGSNIISGRFGSPEMTETDAERAILAALELISAKQDNPRYSALNLRIGIASGLVWTRPIETAVSQGEDLSNVVAIQASSLRELAGPDTILITEGTRDFVKELFEYVSGKQLILRNFSEPVRAFAVARPSETENRFEALRSQRLPFLGRDRELCLLANLWKSARSGVGQAVLVTGGPGMGKSRLASEFDWRLEAVPVARMRLFGSPHHQNSALYPFARLLERLCGFSRGDEPEVKEAKLRDFLTCLGLRASENAAYFASVLGLSSRGSVLPQAVNARKHRELLLNAFLALIEAQASQGPVLIIFEDLHWADPTSRDLVGLIVGLSRNVPLMVLGTARPEFFAGWATEERVSRITLKPLSQPETAAFISLISKKQDMAAHLSDYIIECTGGVPLFVEELTKVFIETGLALNAGGLKGGTLRASITALPISIQAALHARIDRLAEGKAVARIASVLGRRFSHQLLEGVAGLDREELNLGLARLIDAGLILRRGAPPEADYLFKHALVQEVAYSTLSGIEKRALHLRAAELLQTLSKVQPVEPEAVANHLTLSGESDAAASHWLRAGQRAIARSANLEAIEHLRAGLKALRKVAPSVSRDERERHLLMALGPALMAVHGYGATEGQSVCERAWELVNESTPVPERLHILCGLWNVRSGRSELYPALRLAEQFLKLARKAGAGLNLANCMMGQTLAAMGELKRAQGHFLYVTAQFRNQDTFRFTADEHILALSYLGRVLWTLGYPEQAAAATEEALERARNCSDAVSVAIALVGQLFMATHRGDIETASAKIDEAVAHCTQYGLYLFEHWVKFNRGALLVRQGDACSGIDLMRSAIAAADARRNAQFRTFQLYCIADAQFKLGAYQQALTLADEALLLAEKTGERWVEAGVRRVRAEVLAELGRARESRREFQYALKVAGRQGARLEELRIATSIARRAVGTKNQNAAAGALSAVYSSFEEGHGLPDLGAARQMLDKLGFPRT